MAAVTGFVDGCLYQHGGATATVGIVAAGAAHYALLDRMAGKLEMVGALLAMTVDTAIAV